MSRRAAVSRGGPAQGPVPAPAQPLGWSPTPKASFTRWNLQLTNTDICHDGGGQEKGGVKVGAVRSHTLFKEALSDLTGFESCISEKTPDLVLNIAGDKISLTEQKTYLRKQNITHGIQDNKVPEKLGLEPRVTPAYFFDTAGHRKSRAAAKLNEWERLIIRTKSVSSPYPINIDLQAFGACAFSGMLTITKLDNTLKLAFTFRARGNCDFTIDIDITEIFASGPDSEFVSSNFVKNNFIDMNQDETSQGFINTVIKYFMGKLMGDYLHQILWTESTDAVITSDQYLRDRCIKNNTPVVCCEPCLGGYYYIYYSTNSTREKTFLEQLGGSKDYIGKQTIDSDAAEIVAAIRDTGDTAPPKTIRKAHRRSPAVVTAVALSQRARRDEEAAVEAAINEKIKAASAEARRARAAARNEIKTYATTEAAAAARSDATAVWDKAFNASNSDRLVATAVVTEMMDAALGDDGTADHITTDTTGVRLPDIVLSLLATGDEPLSDTVGNPMTGGANDSESNKAYLAVVFALLESYSTSLTTFLSNPSFKINSTDYNADESVIAYITSLIEFLSSDELKTTLNTIDTNQSAKEYTTTLTEWLPQPILFKSSDMSTTYNIITDVYYVPHQISKIFPYQEDTIILSGKTLVNKFTNGSFYDFVITALKLTNLPPINARIPLNQTFSFSERSEFKKVLDYLTKFDIGAQEILTEGISEATYEPFGRILVDAISMDIFEDTDIQKCLLLELIGDPVTANRIYNLSNNLLMFEGVLIHDYHIYIDLINIMNSETAGLTFDGGIKRYNNIVIRNGLKGILPDKIITMIISGSFTEAQIKEELRADIVSKTTKRYTTSSTSSSEPTPMISSSSSSGRSSVGTVSAGGRRNRTRKNKRSRKTRRKNKWARMRTRKQK